MANHKSALKRNRQSQEKRIRNRSNRTVMKNAVKKVNEAVATGVEETAKEALIAAISVIAKTASKGTIHKKNASRKISRLTKNVNKMQATV